MKITALLLFAFSILSAIGNAQGRTTRIHGRVVDKSSRENLVHAAVALHNSLVGTITNSVGEFDLVIKDPQVSDTLVFSMLGYKTQFFSVALIAGRTDLVIDMEENPIYLDEIAITDQRFSAEDYLSASLKGNKNRRTNDPYILSMFFRETEKINERYFSLIEAAGTLEVVVAKGRNISVDIQQIRRSIGAPPNVPTRIGQNYNPFRELDASFFFEKRIAPCRKCKYEIQEFSILTGRPMVIIVSYKNPERREDGYMRFVIDLEDFGIRRFEFAVEIPFGEGFPEVLDNSINSSLVYLHRQIDYNRVDGRYYLHQYHQQAKHEYRGIREKTSYTTDHFFSLLINDVSDNKSKSPRNVKEMNYKHSISSHVKKYDPEFWKTYNVIKLSPLDDKVIEDLGESAGKVDLFD